MKRFVSAALCAALCAVTTVSAWGVTPAVTGDTSNIPLLIVLCAVAVIAIVAVLVIMNKKKKD